jgi:hypothetical protein
MLLAGYLGPSGGAGGGILVPLPPDTVASPASIIAQYLIDQLVASSPANNPLVPWPIFVNGMPATGSEFPGDVELPAEAISAGDTDGIVNSKDMEGKAWEHEGVNILVRTIDPSLGYAKAKQIRDTLDPAAGAIVTVGEETWRIVNITRNIGIASLGQDPETREDLFTVNVRVSIRAVA